MTSTTSDIVDQRCGFGMQLGASGEVRLRSQRSLLLSSAAEAQRRHEEGHSDHKLLLTSGPDLGEVAK